MREIYEFLIPNSIAMSAVISLVTTLITVLIDKSKTIPQILAWGVIVFALVASFKFLWVLFYFPVMLLPFAGIVGALVVGLLKTPSERFLKRYAIVQYVLVMAFLLLAIEMAKASFNTWGSGPVYPGIFMIVFLVPLRHLTRKISPVPFVYGGLDFLIGLSSMSFILVFGFSESMFNGDSIPVIRKGLVLLSMTLAVEGVLFLCKDYRARGRFLS